MSSHHTDLTSPLLDLLAGAALLPILTIDDAGRGVSLAGALAEGGLTTVEVTLRTAASFDAIDRIVRELPDVTVGAGTVLGADALWQAENSGASFAVSPGLTDELARATRRSRVPLLPGVATASEAMSASGLGFEVLKLFPASVIGGASWLRAIAGPLPDLRFCPTGGVRADTYADYLALDNVACVGGSWMVDAEAVDRDDWQAIRQAAQEIVDRLGSTRRESGA